MLTVFFLCKNVILIDAKRKADPWRKKGERGYLIFRADLEIDEKLRFVIFPFYIYDSISLWLFLQRQPLL